MEQTQTSIEEKLSKTLTMYVREVARVFGFDSMACFLNALTLLRDLFDDAKVMFKPVYYREECGYFEKGDFYYWCVGHLTLNGRTYHVQVYWRKTSNNNPDEDISINVIKA